MNYKRVEKENVDIVEADAVMVLATFLWTIAMLIQAYVGTSFHNEADHHPVSATQSHAISNRRAAFSVPKWDYDSNNGTQENYLMIYSFLKCTKFDKTAPDFQIQWKSMRVPVAQYSGLHESISKNTPTNL